MNYTVLKDIKTTIGLTSAILLNVFAIISAATNWDYTAVLIVLAQIPLFYAITRANRLYKEKG
ncbi:hypothetical protein [Oceanobacillus kapialis]|uniref:Uncharacterized protein n=1 Tax=Oceanobacillus kapialis TaxID=481353 RepID=A0ABW5PWU3_9BACI